MEWSNWEEIRHNLSYFKWKFFRSIGIKPKLSKIVLNNIKEKEAESKGYVPTPTPVAKKCSYSSCKKILKGLTYFCPYCHKRYCERHRLPEDHNCPNPQLPYEMRLGYGKKTPSKQMNKSAEAQKN
jgi:hypothetical protein